jgi:hypothetical protein
VELVIAPMFSFYGGKHRAALLYPEPRYPRIVEHFAGSAGYASRYHTRDVTLVEIDPVIAGLWRYLIAVSPAEILALPDVVEDRLDVEPVEAQTLVGFWIAPAQAVPARSPSAWSRGDAAPMSKWGPWIKRRLARQVQMIRHWTVIEGSYHDAPDIVATHSIDPPYQDKGRHYRHGSDAIDFEDLAEHARTRRGQVFVCEQQGATWLPFEPLAHCRGQRGTSAEVIWSNTPPAQTSMFAGLGASGAAP